MLIEQQMVFGDSMGLIDLNIVKKRSELLNYPFMEVNLLIGGHLYEKSE